MISIIIPALNEAAYIDNTIKNAQEAAADLAAVEIIVVDNGSEDDTVKLASESGAKVILAPQLKGLKYAILNFGAAKAKGKVLLFLDADTILPENFDEHIKKGLGRKNVVGGAFEFSFDKTRPDLNLITIINRIRYRIRKRFYGDQGIFVLKDIFEASGGYPERKILEAAYLCKNLQQFGKLVIISKKVRTSSRRFINGGVFKVFFNDMKIWLLDLLGWELDKHGEVYWSVNDRK